MSLVSQQKSMEVKMNSLSPFLHLFILSVVPLLLSYILKTIWKSVSITTNLPPSPSKLPIIGNLHQLGKLPHQNLCKLSEKYGPVMLLKLGSVPTLVVSSPHYAKQVLKEHDTTFCSRARSPGPRRIFYGCSDVAFSPYGDHWKKSRKVFVSHLLGRTRSFSEAGKREIGLLIDDLAESSSNPVNLEEKVFDLIDGVIGGVAFGKSFKAGKKFEGQVLKDVMVEAMHVIDSFSAEDFFPWFGWAVDVLTGHKSKVDKCFRKLDGYLQMVLDDHTNGKKTGDDQDLVDELIALYNQKNGLIISKDHIKAILMNALLGGVDTSSIVIVWAMCELIRNPSIMGKAQEEIRLNIIHTRKEKVGADDLDKFTYLKMIVKETLRLHPPVPFLIPRESRESCQLIRSDVNNQVYNIEAKTRVLINAWAIGRDPNSWKNPSEFYPERFDQNEVDFRGQHFEFVPFGGGRRICPSINNSIATIELTLANLLCWFDWKVPDGMKMENVAGLEEEGGVTVHKRTPLTLVPIKHTADA